MKRASKLLPHMVIREPLPDGTLRLRSGYDLPPVAPRTGDWLHRWAGDAAFAKVTPDTVGKILMTSGSTSQPKGVQTTHRMKCVNQAMLQVGLPFLTKSRR